jgi:hypothetical protein
MYVNAVIGIPEVERQKIRFPVIDHGQTANPGLL